MFTPVISYTPEQVMKCSEYLVQVWADVKVETWTVSGTRASPCDCNNLCCHPLCSCRCLMEAVLFCPTSTRRRILFTGHRVSRSPPTAMWLWLTPVITVLRCTVTFSDSASLSCTSTADHRAYFPVLPASFWPEWIDASWIIIVSAIRWIFGTAEACKVQVWSHSASRLCWVYTRESSHIVHVCVLFSFLIL